MFLVWEPRKWQSVIERVSKIIRQLHSLETKCVIGIINNRVVEWTSGSQEWLSFTTSGETRELRLDEASFERAVTLLRRVPEFTIAAALRQEEANSGTIVAFSHGNNR